MKVLSSMYSNVQLSNLDNLNKPHVRQDISAYQLSCFGFCPWYPRRFSGPSVKSLRFAQTNNRIHDLCARQEIRACQLSLLGSVQGILGASSGLRSRAECCRQRPK